jgi:hypothetical protein
LKNKIEKTNIKKIKKGKKQKKTKTPPSLVIWRRES